MMPSLCSFCGRRRHRRRNCRNYNHHYVRERLPLTARAIRTQVSLIIKIMLPMAAQEWKEHDAIQWEYGGGEIDVKYFWGSMSYSHCGMLGIMVVGRINDDYKCLWRQLKPLRAAARGIGHSSVLYSMFEINCAYCGETMTNVMWLDELTSQPTHITAGPYLEERPSSTQLS